MVNRSYSVRRPYAEFSRVKHMAKTVGTVLGVPRCRCLDTARFTSWAASYRLAASGYHHPRQTRPYYYAGASRLWTFARRGFKSLNERAYRWSYLFVD